MTTMIHATTATPIAVVPPGPTYTSAAAPAGIPGLPLPEVPAAESSDALYLMLVAMQNMSLGSMEATQQRLEAAKKHLNESLQELMAQVREMIRLIEEAEQKEDDGGWFDSICDVVSDIVSEVVGAVANLLVETVGQPLAEVVDVVDSLTGLKYVFQQMNIDLAQLLRDPETAEALKGFTKGVVDFALDASAFLATGGLEILQAVMNGESVSEACVNRLSDLGNSFAENILDNPQFWTVFGTAVKVAAIASAAMTGGAAGLVAVGVMALVELDQRTNMFEKAFGEGAAPWVRLGVAAVGLVAGGAMSQPSGWLPQATQYMQAGTAILQGAGTIYQGIKQHDALELEADLVEARASIQETASKMAMLRRLVDECLNELKDKNEDRQSKQEMGARLVQTQGMMKSAAIMRA